MNKICTSLEQSKKLIELRINITTADMYYSFDYNIEEYDEDAQIIPKSELGQHFSLFPEDIPAWSLSALLNILHYPSLHKTVSGWRCDFYNKEGTSYKLGESSDNSIDTCYEMVVWLLKNKKL